MKKLKLGLIGCGIAAQDLHYPALKKMENRFEVVLLCNRSPDKALKLQKMYGKGRVVEQYDEILTSSEVDAVVISLPIELNARVALMALRAGKHVLCEKPIAATPIEARKVLWAAHRSSKVYQLAESASYDPDFNCVRQLVRGGRLGNVFYALDLVHWKHDDVNKYSQTLWRKNPAYLGGLFMDGGVHNMSQHLRILGNARTVSGTGFNLNFQKRQPNVAALNFQLKSGAVLTLNFVMAVRRHFRYTVYYGTKATLHWTQNRVFLTHPDGREEEIKYKGKNGFHGEFDDFYQAITRKRAPFMSAAAGLQDFMSMYTGFKAIVSGKRLTIPA